jgi:hypothetical protein
MANSGLGARPFRSPLEVVAWHGAMQAQDYGLAKWSIGQRTLRAVDEDVDRALEGGAIVRTHVLRPTWHFVAAGDIRWMLSLTAPRVHQHLAPRFRELGLDHRSLRRCEALIASALQGGGRMTRREIGGVLTSEGVDTSGQRLPHIFVHCELEAVICSGGLAGKQQTYALFEERIPKDRRFDRDEALVELVRRYLQSHGPATLQDLRWWSSVTMTDLKKGLHLLGSDVRSEAIGGRTFWSLTADRRPVRSPRRAHLLQLYDELLVGYTESRFFGDPGEAAARSAWKDRSGPTGAVLFKGGLIGHWRRTVKKDSVSVEVFTYDDLTAPAARALEAAAGDLGRFLGRRAMLECHSLTRAR